MTDDLALGIDFGTSGARAIAITPEGTIQAQVSQSFPPRASAADGGLAYVWKETLFALLAALPLWVRRQTRAIALDGTSSTVLLCDHQGVPLGEPLLYSDGRSGAVLDAVRAIAPAQHTVISATSSLAKLLWWQQVVLEGWSRPSTQPAPYFLHQADWLSYWLHGQLGVSDYHNALKLGYDVGELRYPDWLLAAELLVRLPEVRVPGDAIAPVTPQISAQFAFPSDCYVHAGTTDSIAAFLASGVHTPGEAVTSLGSTLVLKLLSDRRVDDVHYGIYSHRLGDLWLVGGASNVGGAVLRHFFTDGELVEYSQQIDPEKTSPLQYYPLLTPGERFPIADPHLQPQLDPRPENPVEFLHGLLDSLSRIEAQGYGLLQQLGATPLSRVYTAGGGAKNAVWMQLRSRYLKVPVLRSPQTEAAYGSALLALQQAF